MVQVTTLKRISNLVPDLLDFMHGIDDVLHTLLFIPLLAPEYLRCVPFYSCIEEKQIALQLGYAVR